MAALNKPILFLATTDPECARTFYEDALGFTFVADEPFALIFDVAGTMLRIQKLEQMAPVQHTVLGWAVDDIHATIAGLRAKRVEFERYEGMPQDEHGVWETPAGAKVAWFKDPDGNTLSLTQF